MVPRPSIKKRAWRTTDDAADVKKKQRRLLSTARGWRTRGERKKQKPITAPGRRRWNSAVTEPKSVDHLDQPRCSFRRRSKAAAPTSRTRCHFCCGRSNGRDLAAYPAVEAAGADRFFIVPHHAAACFCWVHSNTTTAHAAARTTQNTHASTTETIKGSCIVDVFDIQGYC